MTIFSSFSRAIAPMLFCCLVLALIATGCSSTSKIAQNGRGSVFLEEVMDWTFEASHPAVIDQITILKIMKGVHSSDVQQGSTRMSASGSSKPMRVFSDEDAEFLAPLLAQGLSKAKPEQLVGFRVSSSAGSGSEPTAGSIYVRQDAIHFTVSRGAGPTIFLPESAARSEQAPAYATGGKAGAIAHVIDYHMLARAPMPAALSGMKTPPVQTAPSAVTAAAVMTGATAVAHEGGENGSTVETQVQLRRAKDMLTKKDTEINILRKESTWMKRELRERDEEIKALKATVKKTPKKKAEAYRTH
ncbi:MAG TPA: hypothetical protein VFQ02_04570 [Nitrospira sp.]|nr:hypothetical protein [Nitrospira sp.]